MGAYFKADCEEHIGKKPTNYLQQFLNKCTSFLYRTTFVVLPAGQVGSSAENTMTAQAGGLQLTE
jgi:hypothetical protein